MRLRYLAAITAVALAAVACGDDGGRDSEDGFFTTTTTPSPSNVVTYRWSGTAGGVNVTMTNRQGNTEQASDRANDQELTIGSMRRGEFVYISVQNTGESGSVECEIEVDGTVIERASSTGAYVIATCSGTVR